MNWIDLIQTVGTVAIVGAAWSLSGRLATVETDLKWIKEQLEKL